MRVTKLYAGFLAALLGTMPAGYATMASAEPAAKAAPAGGPQEGIKVHGDWTIEVRDADGTLAHRREFKNALTATGALGLVRLLTRGLGTPVGPWNVWVGFEGAAGSSQPCTLSDRTTNVPCAIVESDELNAGIPTQQFRNLVVSIPSSGPNANKLVLSGSATAANSANINFVETTNPFAGAGVTKALLSTPIPVAAGQIIQVTVVISFS